MNKFHTYINIQRHTGKLNIQKYMMSIPKLTGRRIETSDIVHRTLKIYHYLNPLSIIMDTLKFFNRMVIKDFKKIKKEKYSNKTS